MFSFIFKVMLFAVIGVLALAGAFIAIVATIIKSIFGGKK